MKSTISKIAVICGILFVSTQLQAENRRIYFVNQSTKSEYVDVYYKKTGSNETIKTSFIVHPASSYTYNWDSNDQTVTASSWVDRCSVEKGIQGKAEVLRGGKSDWGNGGQYYIHVFKRLTDYYCDYEGN